MIRVAMAGMAGVLHADRMHSTALAVDPLNWELVHFTLWAGAAPDTGGISYKVLHTSTPELDDLAQGRHWRQPA